MPSLLDSQASSMPLLLQNWTWPELCINLIC